MKVILALTQTLESRDSDGTFKDGAEPDLAKNPECPMPVLVMPTDGKRREIQTAVHAFTERRQAAREHTRRSGGGVPSFLVRYKDAC